MSSLGPVHEIDGHQFSMLSVSSICIDAASLAIGAGGLFLAWRRTAVGGVITAVTLALLPALHIVPIAFDQSLYHERYATMAIAMMCSFLPALVKTAPPMQHIRWLAPTVWALGIAWLAVGVINIRVTLPLWSDEIRLWQWVLRENPDSLVAKDHLLSTYIERDEYSAAGKLADRLVAEKAPCPSCMINAANLAIVRGDAASASAALEIARNSKTIGGSAQLVQQLVVAGGQLSALQHDTGGAEAAYRGAIAMDPLAPQPQMALAILLARTGRDEQAKTQLEVALRLFAPDEREIRRQEFKNAAR
jgi:tetratricopeptide (TPR) repeat protein